MDYTEAIRLSPDLGDAYYRRGCAYQKIGAAAEAERDFLRAKGENNV